jgi:hypothetical protein
MSQLKVDSIVPRGGLPSGSSGGIIQVRSTTKTDTFQTTSNSFVDITGLSVSITPQSSSNKILVMVHLTGDGRNGQARANFRMMRGSTAICIGDSAGSRTRSTFGIYDSSENHSPDNASMAFLDSPATTSSLTYKMQIVNGNNNSDNISVNRAYGWSNDSSHPATTSTITVMEVSG